jgi:histidine ammonia-lyase
MGWSAARKLRQAVDNLARIIAVELVAATRAIEIRVHGSEVLQAAPATEAIVKAVREAGVAGVGPDRFLAPDLAAAYEFVRGGGLGAAAESVTGPLA